MVTLSFWEVVIRLLVATLCGGIIGIDRGRKHRPAGFRTYILVCTGAALTIILSVYLKAMQDTGLWNIPAGTSVTADISRFGAQVINGIGFLGAGTILVTGRQQVKGMTTAAGLWASACMGLAIGAGFYEGALVGCVFILITIIFFSKIESLILSHSRNINVYVEFESIDDISAIIEKIKSHDIKIFDVEISKAQAGESNFPNAIFTLQLPKKKTHTTLITAIAEVDNVRTIEEL